MLKKLKSLFVVEDESAAKPTKEKEEVETVPESTTPVAPQVDEFVDSSATPSQGKVDTKFLNILLGAMDKNNLDGFDYLEYRQSLQNLSKMAMDEATKYKSAFAAAQTMGATPQKLVDTAGHYLQILSKEEQKFNQALANQRKKQIGGKENQYKKLEQSIKDKQTRILQLQKEIEQHQGELSKIKQAVSQATIKVTSTQNDFVATYKSIVDKIQLDIQKMKQYLK
ncbi:MAG: hypothetical protein AAF990_15240 [Bacteroidota bacterium]